MIHRIVNKLHIIEIKGRVNVFTEKEYNNLKWFDIVKLKYDLK